jgi:uncharacterized protein with von Willebrand factor type A (vWA) domain
MLFGFLFALREAGLKPGLGEYLTLLDGLRQHLALFSLDDFYLLARTALIKDESQYDRYDRAFGAYFKGVDSAFLAAYGQTIPEEWLLAQARRLLSEDEMRQVQALGGLEKLIETLKQRLEEQKDRHQGGNKWIGTGGTSPFGHSGYNPEGIRIGGDSQHKRAVKIWEQREFRNFDDSVQIGIRNIQVALRKLRRFAREGAPETFDLDGTIASTARNAGWLDIQMTQERRNAIKVLLLLDVGGSMDTHVRVCEELFSACKTEFKHLEYFYFHNFVYETLWKDNRRRSERVLTHDILHRYTPDYRLIFVGDATMSPYEIAAPGGSVEHWNEEAGAVWLQRLLKTFPHAAWLNPEPEAFWNKVESLRMTQQLLGADRMFPLTIDGLERAIKRLRH